MVKKLKSLPYLIFSFIVTSNSGINQYDAYVALNVDLFLGGQSTGGALLDLVYDNGLNDSPIDLRWIQIFNGNVVNAPEILPSADLPPTRQGGNDDLPFYWTNQILTEGLEWSNNNPPFGLMDLNPELSNEGTPTPPTDGPKIRKLQNPSTNPNQPDQYLVFLDAPWAAFLDGFANFDASLYLTTWDRTHGGNVTIHDGIRWGYQITSDSRDFGDAPDSYKTFLVESDGPRYQEGRLQRLGNWDIEPDGQPTPRANGDDLTNMDENLILLEVDDEDGINIGPDFVEVFFKINRPGANQYQFRGWWDRDNNGMFEHQDGLKPGETGEELFINDLLTLDSLMKESTEDPSVVIRGNGLFSKRYDLDFNPQQFFSRFRLTWDPRDEVRPFGEVFSQTDCPAEQTNCISHGEVEDYAPVPEPLTIIASGLAVGFGVLCQREYSKKRRKK